MTGASSILVRNEEDRDRSAVRQLHLDGFPTTAEADLVDRLRRDGDAVLSLVAWEGDTVAGHVMLSRMTSPKASLGLAPVTVAAALRKHGIAAKLIESGIDLARSNGWKTVFVLGDPAYYGRFGFSPEAAAGYASPFAGPYFMALPLDGIVSPPPNGTAEYARGFADLA